MSNSKKPTHGVFFPKEYRIGNEIKKKYYPVGAAWQRSTEDGKAVISIKLDIPIQAEELVLFESTEDGDETTNS